MNPDRAQVDSDSWPPGSGQNGRSEVCRANIRPSQPSAPSGPSPPVVPKPHRQGPGKVQPNRSVPAHGHSNNPLLRTGPHTILTAEPEEAHAGRRSSEGQTDGRPDRPSPGAGPGLAGRSPGPRRPGDDPTGRATSVRSSSTRHGVSLTAQGKWRQNTDVWRVIPR